MFSAQQISYQQTGFFSRIVLDYLNGSNEIKSFYSHTPDLDGIKQAINDRENFNTNRNVLVEVLNDQYNSVDVGEKTKANINQLLNTNCFTICTAHQPNLATGPLYFIFKIIHVIKLSDTLNSKFPDKHFVPVYYMGSEDADLQELNHFIVGGKKYEWNPKQQGAVGRMIADDQLINLLDELEKQLDVEIFGNEFITLLKKCFVTGTSIQQSTFRLVQNLFDQWGLIVLIADDARFKKQMIKLFEDDLLHHKPSAIVEKTIKRFPSVYNVQASAREINLFYLDEQIRERIERSGAEYKVVNTSLRFSQQELLQLLEDEPGKFSPNVILRGIFQETILPNIAFIGGGGELAYWLELKDLFDHYKVPYPVIVLRNSFLIVDKKLRDKISRTRLSIEDFFADEHSIMNMVVKKQSLNQVSLNGSMEKATELFAQVKEQASSIDSTLSNHVSAIEARYIKLLQELEKKMLRAEKRKFIDTTKHVQTIRAILFPGNSLQERKENLAGFYARFGKQFIEELYHYSLGLEQEFVVLTEDQSN